MDTSHDSQWVDCELFSTLLTSTRGSAGSLEIVDMLIKNGASVNHVNNKGQASLHYAASKNHATVSGFRWFI